MKLNFKKVEFFKNEIKFLGHRVSYNTIKPLENRAQGIKDFPRPKNKKEVQRFIGLVNYNRKFIKDISILTNPLTNIVGEKSRFVWNDEQENAFSKLKEKCTENLELTIADHKKKFTLETDASDIGIGAILRQDDKIICYSSMKLNKSERKYGITEKETLAALRGMEKFKYYLLGRKFNLISDHRALEEINRKKEFGSARIQRWLLRFSEYTFDPIYRKAEEMVAADALSRSVKNRSNDEIEEAIMRAHRKLNHRKGHAVKHYLEKENYSISLGKISDTLSGCKKCLKYDFKIKEEKELVKTSRPFEKVGIDVLELKPGYKVLTAIDYFTRYGFTKLASKKSSRNVFKFVQKIIQKFNVEEFVSDNGKEFSNSKLKQLLDENGTKHHLTTAYHSESNGRIERFNRTILNAIKKADGPLNERIKRITMVYNNTYHRSIGFTPIEALERKNHDEVIETQNKISQEYKTRKKHQMFSIGDKVIIKNG